MREEASSPEHPRVQDWPFMGTPAWPLMTTATYLYVVLWWGPRFMKSRPAYSFKTFIYLYNFSQVVINAIMFHVVLTSGWTTTYTLGCQLPDWSDSREAMRMASAMWWWFLIKKVELIETVLYVLRKKDRQVSFLHIYHHVSTFLITWTAARFCPGGSVTFSVLPNSLVHVIMYSYFLLSAIDNVALKKVLSRVKKYLTTLQLVQLTIIMLHAAQGFSGTCHAAPKPLMYSFVPNMLLLIYLFFNFYRANYKPKSVSSSSYSSEHHGKKIK
ncbi:elongation of very long chain fatty acids protein 4-like [Thrips palmi]|uniref:Elongation of very long chain fatty acids protein n=1 Tax=Thrips palmi TaxID=161013 RepID=A0A6P8YFU8_THRPL|nr:elongation of very long chain fatty acids protein 4-like [Thrips palmi]